MMPVMLIAGFARPAVSIVPPTNCGHKVPMLRPGCCAAKVKDSNLCYREILVLDPPEYREWSA
jgi:hypothetical protein